MSFFFFFFFFFAKGFLFTEHIFFTSCISEVRDKNYEPVCIFCFSFVFVVHFHQITISEYTDYFGVPQFLNRKLGCFVEQLASRITLKGVLTFVLLTALSVLIFSDTTAWPTMYAAFYRQLL